MVDYCMCHGGDCSVKENCYRYRAKADEYRQSFFIRPPLIDGKCEHFMDASKWGIGALSAKERGMLIKSMKRHEKVLKKLSEK